MKIILESGTQYDLSLTHSQLFSIAQFMWLDAGAEGSHGLLDMQTLVTMLLEDVALMVERPGSWEGSNMVQVVRSHGYGH